MLTDPALWGSGRGEQDQDATDTTTVGAASNLAGPIKDLGIIISTSNNNINCLKVDNGVDELQAPKLLGDSRVVKPFYFSTLLFSEILFPQLHNLVRSLNKIKKNYSCHIFRISLYFKQITGIIVYCPYPKQSHQELPNIKNGF